MKIICLTGGLASGKSTASAFLAALGAKVIDADKLGHKAYDPGSPAYRQVIDTFGEDVVADDKQINRKVLGGKVFGKPEELKKLTDIVWPEIRHLAELEISAFEVSSPGAIIVLEAAVLFEAGWEDMGDEIWVVVADRDVAIARAMARDGMAKEAVESRLDAQLTNEQRISKATVVINNNGTQTDMKVLVDRQWQRVVSRA